MVTFAGQVNYLVQFQSQNLISKALIRRRSLGLPLLTLQQINIDPEQKTTFHVIVNFMKSVINSD